MREPASNSTSNNADPGSPVRVGGRLASRLLIVAASAGVVIAIAFNVFSLLELQAPADEPIHARQPPARVNVDATAARERTISAALLLSGGVAAGLLLALFTLNRQFGRRLRAAALDTHAQKARYQRLFDEHPLPIWIFDDASLGFVAVNRAAVRAYGYSEAEMLRMSLRDIRPEQDLERLDKALSTRVRKARGSICAAGVWVHRTRSGERRTVDVHFLQTEHEGRPATMSVLVDVTQEVAAKAELFRAKQTLESVLDQVPQAIAWKDARLRYMGGNEIYARDAGLSGAEQLRGLTDQDLHWGDADLSLQAEDARVMAGELVKKHVERPATRARRHRDRISENKVPLKDSSGAVVGVLSAYQDITARRNAELALRLQSRAVDASINGILITEPRHGHHVVLFANRAFGRITGHALDEATGADCESLFTFSGDPATRQAVRASLDSDTESNVTLRCVRKSGERFWANILVAPVRDDDGRVCHHVAVMSDVTAVTEYQARLEYQAEHDALTGLPNRVLLQTADARHRARARAGARSP